MSKTISIGPSLALAAAAAMIGGLGGQPITIDSMRRVPVYPDHKAPAPTGPVTDSTKESKRAKRRRLAREMRS